MATELATRESTDVTRPGARAILPALIADAGERAGKRFVEFFTATIRNANTRKAYARAVASFFGWCEVRGIRLD